MSSFIDSVGINNIIILLVSYVILLALHVLNGYELSSACKAIGIKGGALCYVPYFNVIPLSNLGDVAGDKRLDVSLGRNILVPRIIFIILSSVVPILFTIAGLFRLEMMYVGMIIQIIGLYFIWQDLCLDMQLNGNFEIIITSVSCAVFGSIFFSPFVLHKYRVFANNNELISQSYDEEYEEESETAVPDIFSDDDHREFENEEIEVYYDDDLDEFRRLVGD